MQKSLNTNLIKERLFEYGLNQSSLSKELGVSREAVSQWLKNKSLPKAAKLLKLGKLLNLPYSELITKNNDFEPKIAFRKVGNSKTRDSHIKRATEMGYALEQLVEFLPQEFMIKPPALKTPIDNYKYVQSAAKLIRNKFVINDLEIKFAEIISLINSFNAIIIPVMLGNQKAHANALHIYLPKSKTTWIYINLDTKVFDFKFWLSHELGHILTPTLSGDEAENFADNFAGAILFPKERAKLKYEELSLINRKQQQINSIIDTARELIISPITILKEVEKYVKYHNLKNIDMGNNFFGACTNFTSQYKLVSENIFGIPQPDVNNYIKESEDKFGTLIFDMLKKYDNQNGLTASYIKSVLNVPFIDAKEICLSLTNAAN